MGRRHDVAGCLPDGCLQDGHQSQDRLRRRLWHLALRLGKPVGNATGHVVLWLNAKPNAYAAMSEHGWLKTPSLRASSAS